MALPGITGWRIARAATALCAAGAAGCAPTPPPATQPIAFSHQIHMAKDMDCSTCHEHADTSDYATLPSNGVCLDCHQDPVGKNPEEPKVRLLAAKGPIPWVQVNRLPGHVYFSHRAHVTWGKVECQHCHGDMAKASQPVTQTQIASLDMNACMRCHQKDHAHDDCLTCHK